MKSISREQALLIENRIFDKDSVDSVLQDMAEKVTEQNVSIRYRTDEDFSDCLLSEDDLIDRYILQFIANSVVETHDSILEKVNKIAEFTSKMGNSFPLIFQNNEETYRSPNEYFWGGSEELLIVKGSDWCGEVARVFCALTQIHSIPSRILYTFGNDDGHVINEVFVGNKWVMVDSSNGIVYENIIGENLSILDVFSDKVAFSRSLEQYSKYYYSDKRFFENIFVSYYWIKDSRKYKYHISFCNEYYRILLSKCWNQ